MREVHRGKSTVYASQYSCHQRGGGKKKRVAKMYFYMFDINLQMKLAEDCQNNREVSGKKKTKKNTKDERELPRMEFFDHRIISS